MRKGWSSAATALQSQNTQGKPEKRKQKGFDALRVYWAPVVCRGKVHLELLGNAFPGETAEGAAQLVAKVRSVLNIRFQGRTQPTTLFTDKGRGFFHANGKITDEYKQALKDHKLKAYYPLKSDQPGNLQEVVLHETVVSWVRARETVTLPREPWKETPESFAARLREIAHYINDNYDVEGLCTGFPKRLQMLADARGDRINK